LTPLHTRSRPRKPPDVGKKRGEEEHSRGLASPYGLHACAQKALRPWARTAGSLSWSYDGEDRPFATIGYEADLTDESDARLRLRYQADGEPLDYKIRLVTTIPNYGGRRWWFICPLSRDDGGPLRRVAKLYLPPGERYFGSREAYE
jgi:hypothetical protein